MTTTKPITPDEIRREIAEQPHSSKSIAHWAHVLEISADSLNRAANENLTGLSTLKRATRLVRESTANTAAYYAAAQEYAKYGCEDEAITCTKQADLHRDHALILLANAIGDYETLCKRANFVQPGTVEV